MAECVCVDPNIVHSIWPKVSHWIEQAYRRNSDETFEDTERDVLAGHALLWVCVPLTAAAVSKIWTFKSRKICTVLAVGGAADNWPELLLPIEHYAKQQGCGSVRIEGRSGWQRVFPDYQQPWIVLEKRL